MYTMFLLCVQCVSSVYLVRTPCSLYIFYVRSMSRKVKRESQLPMVETVYYVRCIRCVFCVLCVHYIIILYMVFTVRFTRVLCVYYARSISITVKWGSLVATVGVVYYVGGVYFVGILCTR